MHPGASTFRQTVASVSIETGLAVAAVASGVVSAERVLGALLLEPATGRSQVVADLLKVLFGFCYHFIYYYFLLFC